MLRLAVSLALCLMTVAAAGAQTPARPTAEALARNLQQRYQQVRDFSAAFVQTYRGGVLRTQTSERGTVSVKKPGKMRWVYTNPERKEIVADGQKVYSYFVEQKQVYVNDPPANDATAFLAGRGDILRNFTIAYADNAPAGTVALKLTPMRTEADYEFLIVAVDPATLQIRALTTRDRQGGDSTFTFSNMKENQGLADKDFAFRMPRGVNVITDGAR